MVVSFFFMFTPNLGEDEPNLTSIFFKMGWFNNDQLVNLSGLRENMAGNSMGIAMVILYDL